MKSDMASTVELTHLDQTVALTVIPPVASPVMLTARSRVKSLRDHLMAFLNANNPNNFSIDEVVHVPNDTIAEVMHMAVMEDYLVEWRFKLVAKIIKKKSNGAIKNSTALDFVSKMFGYRDWQEAHSLMRDGIVLNRCQDRNCFDVSLFDVRRSENEFHH